MSSPQSNNQKSVGTFGKQAAIGWKYLKQRWLAVSVILIFIIKQVIILEKRLQVLQDQGSKTAHQVQDLIDSAVDVALNSPFKTAIPEVEDNCKIASSVPNPTTRFRANEQGTEPIISPRKDFASFSAGASIIEPSTSPTWAHHRKTHTSRFPFIGDNFQKISGSPPLTVLVSDLSVGACWPFHGTMGQIAIQLSRTIWVEGITLGHVPQSLAYDIQTAPKQFELWGMHGTGPEVDGNLLLEGSYSIDSSNNLQEFSVPKTKLQLHSQVLLKIKSNHGNPDFTCIYRIQVHGELGDMPDSHRSGHVVPT
ncbi:hypothetical protein MJO29_015077 [Puccinia striiformis f. sp. tritici]|nr:hypothetical protein MJO29_015077 [Puccinia striiformis f. sp. tritici]